LLLDGHLNGRGLLWRSDLLRGDLLWWLETLPGHRIRCRERAGLLAGGTGLAGELLHRVLVRLRSWDYNGLVDTVSL
jgi:hypothetical protein